MTDDRSRFVNSYTDILISAWSNPGYLAQLRADPMAVIAEHDLFVPPGSEVVVVDETADEHLPTDLSGAVEAWAKGWHSGRFVLFVPSAPAVRGGELDEGDLAGIVAGAHVGTCCSTPCCCSL